MSDDGVGFSGPDSVTEVTTTGWLQRILGSFVAALIGLIMVVGSVVLLWWNEGRAVQAARALDRGSRQVIEVNATAVDSAASGRLVHMTGMMTTAKPARDGAFDVGADNLLRLRRTVEMYQWTEHKTTNKHKNVGGSETTETTYSYHKEWVDKPVDSGRFHESNGHHNPSMPVTSTTIDAGDVRLGAYRVEPALLHEVSAFARLDVPQNTTVPSGYRRAGDYLYRGQDEANPAIGDVRIQYSAVTAQTMSAVALDDNGALGPFQAANGYRIALAEAGTVPASQMFREKASEEHLITWVLRVVGFVVMLIGFVLMASPLSTVLGVIPLLEQVAEFGAFLMALMVSVTLTAAIIAVAWIAHRPVVGIAVIVGGLVMACLLRYLRRTPPPPTHFLPTTPR